MEKPYLFDIDRKTKKFRALYLSSSTSGEVLDKCAECNTTVSADTDLTQSALFNSGIRIICYDCGIKLARMPEIARLLAELKKRDRGEPYAVEAITDPNRILPPKTVYIVADSPAARRLIDLWKRIKDAHDEDESRRLLEAEFPRLQELKKRFQVRFEIVHEIPETYPNGEKPEILE